MACTCAELGVCLPHEVVRPPARRRALTPEHRATLMRYEAGTRDERFDEPTTRMLIEAWDILDGSATGEWGGFA